MKNNIINITKIIAFILIFIIFYITLTEYKHPNSVDISNIRGIYGEEKNTLDMVYLGGSAAFVYWIPLHAYENYGITSYDYASDTMQAELYKYMVKELLLTQDPEVILIDARAFQYRDKDQPPTSVAYRNVLTGMKLGKNRADFINENVEKYLPDEDKDTYHMDLKLYHTTTHVPDLKTVAKRILCRYKNENKGFYFVPKMQKMQKETFKTKEITPVSEETTDILIDLLDYLKTTNKKVLFIVSPYIETKEHKENFNYIEQKITEAGFDFLDANDYATEMNLNYDTDFYNINHVNYFGAEKYTNFLSQYLLKKYNLPDRRNDKNYNGWNELLPKWHEKVNRNNEKLNKLKEERGE